MGGTNEAGRVFLGAAAGGVASSKRAAQPVIVVTATCRIRVWMACSPAPSGGAPAGAGYRHSAGSGSRAGHRSRPQAAAASILCQPFRSGGGPRGGTAADRAYHEPQCGRDKCSAHAEPAARDSSGGTASCIDAGGSRRRRGRVCGDGSLLTRLRKVGGMHTKPRHFVHDARPKHEACVDHKL